VELDVADRSQMVDQMALVGSTIWEATASSERRGSLAVYRAPNVPVGGRAPHCCPIPVLQPSGPSTSAPMATFP
jgi:hypothetical protein